jgi:hypothetical protein
MKGRKPVLLIFFSSDSCFFLCLHLYTRRFQYVKFS